MIVTYLRFDLSEAQKEIDDTIICYGKFSFKETLYIEHLVATVEDDGDDAQVVYHRGCAFQAYLFFVGTSIFMDKSATYVIVIYLRYFNKVEMIYEYKWRPLVWFTSAPS